MAIKRISFRPEMVRAILREIENPGTGKTMTRRALKPQPVWDNGALGIQDKRKRWIFAANTERGFRESLLRSAFKTPYQIGDLLWVREAWRTDGAFDRYTPTGIPANAHISYLASEGRTHLTGKVRSALFLPRPMSRITLRVIGVNVERVQDISEADATAEGVSSAFGEPFNPESAITDRRRFQLLWDSINGPGAWERNDWVGVYSFVPHLVNVDAFYVDPSRDGRADV